MSVVFHKVNKTLLHNSNPADYSNGEWLIDPDLSAVQNLPIKYCKVDGESVVAMNQAEKDAVDAEENRLNAVLIAKSKIEWGNEIIARFKVISDPYPVQDALTLITVLQSAIFALQLGALETAAAMVDLVPANAILDAEYTDQVWDTEHHEGKTVKQRFLEMILEGV